MIVEPYDHREHSYVKHFILKSYLRRLALKLGLRRRDREVTLNYVDGFSGPWNQAADDLSDTSPSIALAELKAAQKVVRDKGGRLTPRALFIEKDTAAYELLQSKVVQTAGIDVRAIHGEFEDSVPAVLEFIRQGTNPFAFVFVDPKGWTGYPMQSIARILRFQPGEVLVNFQTEWVNRFIDTPDSKLQPSFANLFGTGEHAAVWRGLRGIDRQDAIVDTYARQLRDVGEFAHVATTVVLSRDKEATKYHLIYGTRSLVGLVTFREVERRANEVQVRVRSRQRERATGQLEFPGAVGSVHLDNLVGRYSTRAREQLERLLRDRGQIPYDDVVAATLEIPMITEGDLKAWLKSLQQDGHVSYHGLAVSERVPKRGRDHIVVWRG